MSKETKLSSFILLVLLASFIISASFLSTSIWGGKPETLPKTQSYEISDNMSVQEFGKINSIPDPVLIEVFSLESEADHLQTISETNMTYSEINDSLNKSLAIYSENESKNWIKIFLKFVLWISFLAITFILLRKRQIKPRARKLLYLIGIIIFGIALGSDPNPMGTIKDALVLFGSKGVIFPPRLVALVLFLLLVVVANKFICSWGCQFGVLQDLLFRLNRNKKDRKGIIKQYKIPFVISNTVRIIFFLIILAFAFFMAFDVVENIDPFKIFNPKMLSIIGIVFLGFLLISALFVYRPWCHFFCPFGLIGWLVEKLALFKIRVNYTSCISCESCSKACPSNVMDAILKQNKTIPDCFSCGTCIDVCPTNSIEFSSKKREKAPVYKFQPKK